jgi:hypothetical protein
MLLALQILNLLGSIPQGGGSGSGGRKKRYLLPDGRVVYATYEEIDAVYRSRPEPKPDPVVAVKKKRKQSTPNVDYIELPPLEMPTAALNFEEFSPAHPAYEVVLKTIRRRRDEEAIALLLVEI